MNKLLEKIVHIIVPHRKNNNVPHILRAAPIFALLSLVLFLFTFVENGANIADQLNLTATVYPAVLADLANKDRADQGVKELAWSDTLAEAAKQKGEDMLNHQYFAHTSPDGLTPWYWLTALKYNFSYAGENLAIRFKDSEDVEKAWWDSPGHRANIVNDRFSEIGIAAVEGIFEGEKTTIVVEYFGTPVAQIPFFTESPEVPLASPTPVPAPAPTPLPIVAGADNPSPVVVVAPRVETIKEEEKFLAVKNVEAQIVEPAPTPAPVIPEPVPHVAWYERFVVNPVKAVRTIYISIIAALVVAMALMLRTQIEKHHLRHLSYGVSMVAIVLILLQFVTPGVALI